MKGVKTIVFSLKSTTYTYLTKQHALKGQKLLAQGNALGIKAFSKAPCKGKSFKTSGNNKAFALTGRVFKIYQFFDTFFCVEMQVNSHEINVLRIQKCDFF